MSNMNFDAFLFFAIPIVWILSAFFARHLLIRRGYPRSESWLPGCLLGPLGVFIAVLMPHESPRTRYILQFAGLFFAMTVMSGTVIFLVRGLAQPSVFWFGLFILFEVAIFFIVRKTLPKHKKSPAVDSIAPVQENVSSGNQLWIQSADYSSKTHPLVDARESIRVYRAHDWTKELALLNEMRAKQQDFCPPGIGLLSDDGRFLHICPDGAGRISVYFRPANLPSTTTSTYRDLPESDVQAAIEAFHSGEDAWFRANTSYGT